MGADWDQLAGTIDGGTFVAPLVLDPSVPGDTGALAELSGSGSIRHVSDDYEEQQRELYAIMHPDKVYAPGFEAEFRAYYTGLGDIPRHGRWVYFPWRSLISHILSEQDFRRVRTARNRNLITEKEQERFYNATIGIAGLSVGSNVALALALQGGGKHMRLADMDRLALSNTNRVLAGAGDLGELKVRVAARRIYELNPYAVLDIFEGGLQKENIGSFFEGLDVVVDELDNLSVKYLIREEARKRKIAVVMAADNGDNAVVDVERYDLNPDTPFFHGRLGDVSYEELSSLDKFGIGKTITRHIGPENVTVRMQESLLEMGKTIVSWPQLGGAALLAGASVAYCIRKIVNGQPLEDNRALVSLDEKFIPGFSGTEETAKRTKAANAFKSVFGL